MLNPPSLVFNAPEFKTELQTISRELKASEKDIRNAVNRALRRTAASLRKLSTKGLRQELQLRNVQALRKRLREIKLRANSHRSEIGLWYGMNDLPVSAFKGKPLATGSGASFRQHNFEGAFIGTNPKGKRTIYKRRGAGRFPISEQTVPIKDDVEVFLEDQIFDQVEEIFLRHFKSDLRGRTLYNVGKQR